jgi:hypothetical protein
MNKIYIFIFTVLASLSIAQSLTSKDIMFVGFNADGNDNLAFVALSDIAANTTIYFRDDEWSGSAFVDSAEGKIVWNSGALSIAKGKIVVLNELSTSPITNIGLIQKIGSFNIAGSNDGIFLYTGTNYNTPTLFITAIGNGTVSSCFGSLIGTGLVANIDAFNFVNTIDIGNYNGPRIGSNKSTYQSFLVDQANWISQDGSGSQHTDGIQPDVPFDTTEFTFSNIDTIAPVLLTGKFVSSNKLSLVFSEPINDTTAKFLSNYSFLPALAIDSVFVSGNSVNLFLDTIIVGKKYSCKLKNIADTNLPLGNAIDSISINDLYWNDYSGSDLVITEIMYNIGTGGDSLEFIEVYNKGSQKIPLGGLQLGNILGGTLEEMLIDTAQAIAIAADSTKARQFYKTKFTQQWKNGLLGNGGSSIIISNSLGIVIDTVNYDDALPWPLSPDGTGPSLSLINPTKDNNLGVNWKSSTDSVKKVFGTNPILASPNKYKKEQAIVKFKLSTKTFNESVTSGFIEVEVKNANLDSIKIFYSFPSYTNATALLDYSIGFNSLTLIPFKDSIYKIPVTIINDALVELDEFFILNIDSIKNGKFDSPNYFVGFIKDDDDTAITPAKNLKLNYITSFKNGSNTKNSAEISAYDKLSKQLFIANSINNRLDKVRFNAAFTPVLQDTLALDSFGLINSVAVNNGIVVAVVQANDTINKGRVLFFDTNLVLIKNLEAGFLPDMVCFTPDGKKILIANEGEPSNSYFTDQVGSVSIITIFNKTISSLAQSDVQEVDFSVLNNQKANLKAQGIRLFGNAGMINGNSTVAQDLEPEYIAVSEDSKTAYVTLQENNALMVIDIDSVKIKKVGANYLVKSLGFKDHNLNENALDVSDVSGVTQFNTWKVKGMFMPDAIASFKTQNKNYIITANEGDAREYSGLMESARVASLNLDVTQFPNKILYKSNNLLGRMNVSKVGADIDNDGDIDELFAFGSRSISIWDSVGNLVWDSKNLIEKFLSKDSIGQLFFNASNGSNSKKNRSDDKGPEPEGITTATINGKVYAFATLERIGGVMAFDVTNPINPNFEFYANSRKNIVSTDSNDLGPEGVVFIPAANSPNGKNLLILSNEISSSITIYEVVAPINSAIVKAQAYNAATQFVLYPNPVNEAIHILLPSLVSKSINYSIYDLKGNRMSTRTIESDGDTIVIPTVDLKIGNYILIIKADGKIFPKQFMVRR